MDVIEAVREPVQTGTGDLKARLVTAGSGTASADGELVPPRPVVFDTLD